MLFVKDNILLNIRFGSLLLLEILKFLVEFHKKVLLSDLFFFQFSDMIVKFLSLINTKKEGLEVLLFSKVNRLFLSQNTLSLLMFGFVIVL